MQAQLTKYDSGSTGRKLFLRQSKALLLLDFEFIRNYNSFRSRVSVKTRSYQQSNILLKNFKEIIECYIDSKY